MSTLHPSYVDEEFEGIVGSHSGLYISIESQKRIDDLNERINRRLECDQPLPVLFDPRSVPTKYSQFPIIESRNKRGDSMDVVGNRIVQRPRSANYYDVNKTFAPLNRRGPTNYFLANVDTETVLQNRHVAYQKFADQGVYVPHSSSDLYKVEAVGRQEEQTHPALFVKQEYSTSGSKVASLVGREMFHNNTRTQLRGL